MSLNRWLQSFRSALAPRRGRRKTGRRGPLESGMHRLSLEPLEDRRMLSFTAPAAYDVGSEPREIVMGDFNGDTQADLAVANGLSNDVSVLLGNGDGTFQAALNSPATSYPDHGGPLSLAAGDVNLDGKLDLVTANYDDGSPPTDDDLSVLLGNGDGTFQQPQSWSLPDQSYSGGDLLQQDPLSVAVDDLNGDGSLDVVATGYTYRMGAFPTYVNVLLGDGNGGFGAPEAQLLYYDYDAPTAVTIADLNADGNDDVMTANPSGLSVLLGDGTGSLGSAINSGSGSGLNSISLGDVDGDGNLDTLLTDGTWRLSVQRGDGQGSFTAMPSLGTGGPTDSAVIGDVNGDGTLDLVSVGSNNDTGERQATVFLGDGAGNFAPRLTSDLGPTGATVYPSYLSDAALEDLTGDGLPELLTIDAWNYLNNKAFVAPNDGNWSPSAPLDVDGNGAADALTDGIVILRYLFGFSEGPLAEDALAPDAQRTDAGEIVAWLSDYRDTILDVDGNGAADALTDGIVILRYLFGFTGGPLVDGALAPDAQRTDPDQIVTFLDQFAPGVQGTSPLAFAPLGSESVETSSPSNTARRGDVKRIDAVSGDSPRDGGKDQWLAADQAPRASLYRALAYDALQSRAKIRKGQKTHADEVDLLMLQQ